MQTAFSRFLSAKNKMTNRMSLTTKSRRRKPSLLRPIKFCAPSCVHLWVTLLSLLVGLSPQQLHALPTGGTVQGGNATIQSSGAGSLNINQQSERAIIDWINFNIQSGEQVNFDMPSANSVNLSRVTGGEVSKIFGSLTSNGRLFLVNPNGILFGQGSRVDVNGLVATTSDISNQDFMAGRYNFNIASPFSSSVINRGSITVRQGGLLAFVAPGVENSGIINAQLGQVSLVSGKTFTLDLYGDQLVNLGLDSEITEQVFGPNGQALTSLVSNSGQIFADGGRVTLGVNSARDLVDHAINMSGLIQARSIAQKNGEIYLMGGETGTVNVTGTLDASGYGDGESGGIIHVLGDRVFLDDYGFIDISGDSGGGTLLFGGDYQGNGVVQNATDTFVGADTKIWADAVNTGDGGRTIFWADRRNYFLGRVRARGGAISGDGGFVEVSGKETLFFNGYVDTTATNGETGMLLLDPTDITIVSTSPPSGQPGDGQLPNINASGSGAVSFTISELAMEALSATTNINLLAEDNIIIGDMIDNLLDLKQTSGNRVTMTAQNGNIVFNDINDEIRTAGGDLTLKAGTDMTLGKLNVGAGTVSIFGSDGGSISLGTDTSGDLDLSNTELSNITAGNLIIGGSTALEGRARSINVDGITTGPMVTGMTSLRALSPKVEIVGFPPIIFPEGSVTFGNSVSNFSNTALTVEAFGGVNVNSSLTSNGNLSLDGDFNNFNDTSSAGFSDGLNLVGGIVLNSTAGSLTLKGTSTGIVGAGALTLSGANGVFLDDNITTNGNLTFNNNVTLQGSANAINAGTGKIFFASNLLTALDGLTLNSSADFTGAGPFTMNVDSNANGGALTIASGKTLNSLGNDLNITASDLTLTGNINSGAGATSITSSTSAGIDLAAANTGKGFRLDNAELGRITSGNLGVSAGSGTLVVDNANLAKGVTLGGSTVQFSTTGSTFNSLIVNGSATVAGVNLTTNNGDMTFNNSLSLTNGAVQLSTGAGAGNLTLNGAVDGAQALTLNSGTGSTIFGGNVGSSTALSSLDVTRNTTIANSISVTTTGNTNFQGTVNAGTAGVETLTLNAGSVNLGGNIGDTAALKSLTVNGNVTLDNTLSITTTGNTINLNDTVDAATAGVQGLTLNSGAGSVNLDGNVGSTRALASLNVTGNTTLSGINITTANGDVTFNSGVTLDTGAVNVNTGGGGGNISFDTIDGAQDLALNSGTGSIALNGAVGGTTTLKSLSATGTTTIAGATLATNDGITFNGNVTASAGLALNADADNTGAGTFDQQSGTLSTTGGNDLSITAKDINLAGGTNSGAGITTIIASQNQAMSLGDATGGLRLSNTELGNFVTTGGFIFGNGTGAITANNVTNTLNTTLNGSTVTFNGGNSSFGSLTVNGTTTISGVNITTNNSALTFNNAVSLTTGAVQLSTGAGGGDLTLGGNVDGGQDLTLTSGTGNVVFGGSVGANTRLNSLTVNGTTTFSGASLLTNNGITLNGSVTANNVSGFTLNADADNTGGGTFTQQSGALSTGGNALTITAQDFSLTGTLNSGGGITTLIASQNQAMSLGGAVGGLRLDNTELGQILSGGLVFGNNTGGITLNNVTNTVGTTLNGTSVTFNGANSSFGSLTVNGAITIAGVNITTNNSALTFNNAVSLTTGAVQLSTGALGGDLSLAGNVDGAQALTLNSGTGLNILGGNVGSATALDNLSLTGATQMNGSSIRTNNGMTVNGNFTRNGDLAINTDVNADGTGTFNQTTGTFNTTNGHLNITASDVTLAGTAVTTGSGTMTVADSQNGTVGLGATNCGGACSLTLDGTELQKITTSKLTAGSTTGGAVFVDAVTGAQSAGIGTVNLNSQGLATFDNQSTFNNLNVSADDVVINDVLTATNNGTLTLGTSDGGTLGVGTGMGDMTVDATELALLRAGTLNLGDSTTGNLTLGSVTINSENITQGFNAVTAGALSIQNALVSQVNTMLRSSGAGQGITLNQAGNFFGGTLGLFTGAGGNVAISNLTNNGQTVRLGTSNVGGTFSLSTSRMIQFVGGFRANGTVVVSSTLSGIAFNNGAFLNAGAGTLRLNTAGNLTLGQLISGSSSAQAIHLNVGGAVIDGGDIGGEDIIAATGGLFARTTNGFGTEANPIETRIRTLDITNSGGGDISFFETDSLHIANLTQGGSGDIFGSFNGTLTGEDNIEILIGRFFITDRATGLTLSQELGDTGKDRDALAVERTINNIIDLEFASGANRFDWDPASTSPAGRIKQAGTPAGPHLDDLFSEPFPLVEVKKGNPKDGDLAHLENVWHWNQLNEEETEEAKVRKKKKVAKKKRQKKVKKVAVKKRNSRQDKNDSGVLSFFRKAGSILSFK